MTAGDTLEPEITDLVSAAFEKSWRFVSSDPELARDDMSAMRARLSRHLESLARGGERDLWRLANGAIGETSDPLEAGAEAALDFELGMALVWPQQTVLWHVDDPWYEEQHTLDPLIYKGYFNSKSPFLKGIY